MIVFYGFKHEIRHWWAVNTNLEKDNIRKNVSIVHLKYRYFSNVLDCLLYVYFQKKYNNKIKK